LSFIALKHCVPEFRSVSAMQDLRSDMYRVGLNLPWGSFQEKTIADKRRRLQISFEGTFFTPLFDSELYNARYSSCITFM